LTIITDEKAQGFRTLWGNAHPGALPNHTIHNPLVNALNFRALQDDAMLKVGID
jgi:hypothetical protein